tara:strand:+ start:402 stop:623 length:222 start_codon:yes stop_codon:yes gene_type:complete
MSLSQQKVFDRCEVLANGCVQVCMDNQVIDNSTTPSTIIANNFEKYVLAPGDDYSTEVAQVRAICEVAKTFVL